MIQMQSGLFVPESAVSINGRLKESLFSLEQQLFRDQSGWLRLTGIFEQRDFTLHARNIVNDLAHVFWLKNPLIARGVETENNYVFGRGVTASAKNEFMAEVIEEFWSDRDNLMELTGFQAQTQKNTDLKLFGNVFLALFPDLRYGRVKVRSFPVTEIQDVVFADDDRRMPLYYKRVYVPTKFDWSSGTYTAGGQQIEYIPDWKNTHVETNRPGVRSDVVIYHVKTNCLTESKWGNSEVYRALDWAKAYTRFLEDWATLVASHSQFAFKLRSKRPISSERAALEARRDQGRGELAAPGSWWVEQEGASELTPMPKGGPSVSAEDGRRFLLMVAAGTGIWEHYFGDPSTGNLATSTAMELPMMKMFEARQQFWWEVYTDIIDYAITRSVEAPRGLLAKYGTTELNRVGDKVYVLDEDKVPWKYSVDFPAIIEKDVPATVTAILTAMEKGTVPKREAARLIMTHFGIENIGDHLDELFPPDGEPPAEERFAQALERLTEALEGIEP